MSTTVSLKRNPSPEPLVILNERFVPGLIAKIASLLVDAGFYLEIDGEGPLFRKIKYGRMPSKNELGFNEFDHEIVFERDSDTTLLAEVDGVNYFELGDSTDVGRLEEVLEKLIPHIPELGISGKHATKAKRSKSARRQR
jgi:hypothetical protein